MYCLWASGWRVNDCIAVDDDSYLENLPQQNIGNIRVVVRRGKVGDVTLSHQYDIVASGKVHERSKKGLSHQVK